MVQSSNTISIVCIIAAEFCERFSFCGLRTILSLYLRNILCLHENTATVVYHVFIVLCYTMPVVGAVLADSYMGRYSVILYFSIMYLVGSMLSCAGAIPPLCLSPMWLSLIGFSLVAAGTGGMKPCVAAFGGDQFRLPQENEGLQQFFSVFYCVVNLGGFMGMIMIPELRKSVSCFGDDTCYALGFGVPAIFMLISIAIFVIGKPWYRIKMPKNRVTLHFFSCAWYAFRKHMKHRPSEDGPRPDHWLDHANRRCGAKLIADMKVVFSIMRLYLPVPLFWSLFDQQGSRWTFQVSRLRGQVAGVTLMPDQLQVMNPAMVLLLIPLCPGGVWPIFPNLPTLDKMFVGGLLAAMSFVTAGILQIAIERSTLQSPGQNEAGIALMNTLNCPVKVNVGGFGVETIEDHGTTVMYPLPSNVHVQLYAECGMTCDGRNMTSSHVTEIILLAKRKFTPVLIGQNSDDVINFRYMDPTSFSKSLTGKPKIKVVYTGETGDIHNVSISIKTSKKFVDIYYVSDQLVRGVGESAYMCVPPGMFVWHVKSAGGRLEGEGAGHLDVGGVYVLCARERSGKLDSVAIYAPNPPNELNLFWILPQYIFISLAEIMFAVSGLEFSFIQAPKSMKTITLAAWYVSVAFGNLLVILIAQARIFESQAYEFFLYATLLACGMLWFLLLSRGYHPRTIEGDASSGEGRPLLRTTSRALSIHSAITASSIPDHLSLFSPQSSSKHQSTDSVEGKHLESSTDQD